MQKARCLIRTEVHRKVQLTTPPTPRFTKPVTPKSRVSVAAKLQSSPRTPVTPRTTTVYNQARQLFLRNGSSQLIGRERECTKLSVFLEDGVAAQGGRCLYVSGPPGTGKSAFVESITSRFTQYQNIQTANLNCMSINNIQDVYERLAIELCGEEAPTRAGALDALKSKFFSRSNQVYIVTLDEIDHLLTLDVSGLYTIFEWALNAKSKLLLIGIANALDFTDRFLPRLKARNLQPEVLAFPPYTAEEISSVITAKLRSLLPDDSDPKHIPFLRQEGIKLLAKKVTAQTGDLRKAFDIVRGALDLIEAKAKADLMPATPPLSSPLSEKINLLSPRSHTSIPAAAILSQLTPASAPCATIAHVAQVAAKVFNNGTATRLKSLTLQQKAALCSLVSLEKQTLSHLKELALSTPSRSTYAKSTGTEVRKLFDMYRDLCTKENALSTLTQIEFGEVVDGLLEAGLVREAGKGYGSKGRFKNVIGINIEKRIESAVTENELRLSLEGVGGEVLKSLLV